MTADDVYWDNVRLTVDAGEFVPEPAAFALMAATIFGWMLVRRRK